MPPDRWSGVGSCEGARERAGDLAVEDALMRDVASNAPIGIGARHGWRSVGEPMLITSSTGGRGCTLDGRPALDAYRDHHGVTQPAGFGQTLAVLSIG